MSQHSSQSSKPSNTVYNLHPTPRVVSQSSPSATPGIHIGLLAGFIHSGQPTVIYTGNPTVLPVPANSATPIGAESIGKQVALLFENDDFTQPIILGVLQTPCGLPDTDNKQHEKHRRLDTAANHLGSTKTPGYFELIIDGQLITLQTKEPIVLRSNNTSITLNNTGEITVRQSQDPVTAPRQQPSSNPTHLNAV